MRFMLPACGECGECGGEWAGLTGEWRERWARLGDGVEGGPHGMRMDKESWSSSEMAGLVGGCGGRAGSARGAEKEKKD